MSVQALSQQEIIRKNISAITDMHTQEAAQRTPQDRVADVITAFSGSMAFVYFHALWFGLWILLNVGLVHFPHVSEFDPFPFGLLTMIVSLEAIFLATFVLISQNRLSKVSERRAELDLHVNMLAEQKAAKTLDLLDHVAKQLDGMSSKFNLRDDPEVDALKISPEPHEVLQVMEEALQEQTGKAQQKLQGAVEDITDEVGTMRDDVKRVGQQVKQVSADMSQVQEELKDRA